MVSAAPPAFVELMSMAHDPSAGLTRAFAGVLARFRTLGLERGAFERLLARHFAGSVPVEAVAEAVEDCHRFRSDEFTDLVELLMAHRSDITEETDWLAHAIATACLGDNHLWQDMGLTGREALSALVRTHFRALFEKNTGNMKWKKFFYKQLCARAEVNICKAPSCAVCDDYARCFGPEEA
jgi:nitrogen fixation protein NifQ